MIFQNRRIKELEEENAKLKETILAMSKNIRWCEDKILEISSDIRREKRREWTLDTHKTRKYN